MMCLRVALMTVALCPLLAGCAESTGASAGGAAPSSESTGGVVPSVKAALEWLVAFATEVGEYVSRTASSLGDALAAAWNAFWGEKLVNNVRVDPQDPLRGVYEGALSCRIDWGQSPGSEERKNHVSVRLDHPRMVRASESSMQWELAPEEKDRIDLAVKNFVSAP